MVKLYEDVMNKLLEENERCVTPSVIVPGGFLVRGRGAGAGAKGGINAGIQAGMGAEEEEYTVGYESLEDKGAGLRILAKNYGHKG